MSTVHDMHRLSVAFVAAATEASAIQDVVPSLLMLREIFQLHPELLSALAETVISKEKRQEAIQDLPKVHPLVSNMLLLLIEQEQVREIDACIENIFERLSEIGAYHEILIKSATELSASDRKTLIASFTKNLGGEVNLREKIDPSLLAGVVIEHNGIRVDGSVHGRLNRLTQHLYGT